MKLKELKEVINKDNLQWRKELEIKIPFIFLFLFLREYRIVIRFRLCSYLRTHWFLFPFYCVERFLYRHVTLKNGCDIPSHTKIGEGFVIHHCNGIVIHPRAIIGENFVIRCGSVIGCSDGKVPVIKNNVICGAHTIIIGDITVGNDCIIGAGAVVTKSFPDSVIIAGVPAKIIKSRI